MSEHQISQQAKSMKGSSTPFRLYERAPILTGSYRRRLDSSRRFRLPPSWNAGAPGSWLISPEHLYKLPERSPGRLLLIPVTAKNLKFILNLSPGNYGRPRTIEKAIEVLRANASTCGLPPSVATAFRTISGSTRFCLTKAQLRWLGIHARTIVIIGAGHIMYLYSPAAWIAWKRETKRQFDAQPPLGEIA